MERVLPALTAPRRGGFLSSALSLLQTPFAEQGPVSFSQESMSSKVHDGVVLRLLIVQRFPSLSSFRPVRASLPATIV